MNTFDSQAYGPVLGPFLQVDRRRPLNVGSPFDGQRARLAGVTLESAFGHAQLVDRNMARAVLAGLWLVYNFCHQSHELSQAIDTPTGSFWHGIMHRREGDFWNAKYWFRRVGRHEVLAPLGQRAAKLATARGEGVSTGRLLAGGELVGEGSAGGGFDPLAFVDLVKQVEGSVRADARELCLDIQQAEWELLFDWCYRGAIGSA